MTRLKAEHAGLFPKRFFLSPGSRRPAYVASQIDALIESRMQRSAEDESRSAEIGQRLLAARRAKAEERAAQVMADVEAKAGPSVSAGGLDRAGTLPKGTCFFARFLVARPVSTQGGRMYRQAPDVLHALDRFSQRIQRLLNTDPLVDQEGCLTPPDLSLSPEASRTWIKFHDDVERELGASGEFRDVKDVAAKAGENAARLAGLFHMLEYGASGAISDQHMAMAGRVVAWHLTESRRLFAEIDAPKPLADAIRLDSWLGAEAIAMGSNLVSTQRVRQYGPGRTRENKEFTAAMAELEARGRARSESQGAKRFVAVNPALIEIRP